MLKKYAKLLRKIFKKYCVADTPSASASAPKKAGAGALVTMSKGEWMKFVKDFELVNVRMSRRDARTIFFSAQLTSGGGSGGEGGGGEGSGADQGAEQDGSELIFSEFQEALLAVAA